MKDRLNRLLSEVGESFDYLRSDVRNLSRYMAELEELIKSYRTFATTLTLSTSVERATRRKLLKKTLRVVGPATDARKARKELLAWTSRRQTILSLPPNPRCQNTHELWRCQHAHLARRVFPSPFHGFE